MKSGRILLIDDDAAIRLVVSEALHRDGHTVMTAASLAEYREVREQFAPDLIITDVILPDGNGLDAIAELKLATPDLPIIVLSAQNTLSTAVRATEEGAFEYLPKPFDLDELCRAVRDGLARKPELTGKPIDSGEDLPLIGRSSAMQDIYRTIARVVPLDLSILVLGESGTGKELVARAIHDLGPRKGRPFIAVNMAAIPRELIEADLFGHERGAFTGAMQRATGKFEQASGGTLFLDEIGDMPLDAQTRLLRVLQSGEFTTVGGNRTIRANVRIIAATNRDPKDLIASNKFREDLYYRLNVIPIALPPLRQRGDDIVVLARHFLTLGARQGLPPKLLGESGSARLLSHDWPGNVRELENLVRRLAVLTREDVIEARHVEQQIGTQSGSEAALAVLGDEGLGDAVEQHLTRYFSSFAPDLPPDGLSHRIAEAVDKPLMRAAMIASRGNQIRAAKLLGVNRNTLRKRLGDLGIDSSLGRPVRR